LLAAFAERSLGGDKPQYRAVPRTARHLADRETVETVGNTGAALAEGGAPIPPVGSGCTPATPLFPMRAEDGAWPGSTPTPGVATPLSHATPSPAVVLAVHHRRFSLSAAVVRAVRRADLSHDNQGVSLVCAARASVRERRGEKEKWGDARHRRSPRDFLYLSLSTRVTLTLRHSSVSELA